MIKLTNVFKEVKDGNDKKEIVKDANFIIEEGDFFAIVGPSGAGKSTLLNLLSSIDFPSGGNVFYYDKNITNFSSKERDEFRKNNVSFIFQNFHLIPYLSVLENIKVPLQLKSEKVDRIKIDEICSSLNISHILNVNVQKISTGEKQRVAIARTIISNPLVVFADEPTASLDYENKCIVMDELSRINKLGITIVMVTHDEEALTNVNKIMRLSNGVIQDVVETRDNLTQKNKGYVNLSRKSFNFRTPLFLANKHLKSKKVRSSFLILGMIISLLCLNLSLNFASGLYNKLKVDIYNYLEPNKLYVTNTSLGQTQIPIPDEFMSNIVLDDSIDIGYKIEPFIYNLYSDNVSVELFNETYIDEVNTKFYKDKILSGTLPNKFDEIAVSQSYLNILSKSFNKELNVGDRVKLRADHMNMNPIIFPKYKNNSWYSMDLTITGIISDNDLFKNNSIIHFSLHDHLKNEILFEETDVYNMIVFTKDDVNQEDFLTKYEEYDVNFSDDSESLKDLEENIVFINFIAYGVSLVGIIIAGLMIYVIVYMSSLEREYEVGVLRTIGFSKVQIFLLFIAEMIILALIAATIVNITGVILITIYNYFVESFSNVGNIVLLKPDLGVVNVVYFSAILSAFLFSSLPAYRLSMKNIIDSLKGS